MSGRSIGRSKINIRRLDLLPKKRDPTGLDAPYDPWGGVNRAVNVSPEPEYRARPPAIAHLDRTEQFDLARVGHLVVIQLISFNREIIIRALDAYLDEDHCVFAHLVIPQIEHAIRTLLRKLGGAIYKPAKKGCFEVRGIGSLLDDTRIQTALEDRVVSYLSVLFVDSRWWNLRNATAHGLIGQSAFGPQISDRLVHTLITLGCLRLDDESGRNPRKRAYNRQRTLWPDDTCSQTTAPLHSKFGSRNRHFPRGFQGCCRKRFSEHPCGRNVGERLMGTTKGH